MTLVVILILYALVIAVSLTLLAIIIWNTVGESCAPAVRASGRKEARGLLVAAWAWPVLVVRSVIQIARYKGE